MFIRFTHPLTHPEESYQDPVVANHCDTGLNTGIGIKKYERLLTVSETTISTTM